MLSLSYVLYYEGKYFTKVVENPGFANVINMSKKEDTIYVSTTVGQSFHIFSRNIEAGDLTKTKKLNTETEILEQSTVSILDSVQIVNHNSK